MNKEVYCLHFNAACVSIESFEESSNTIDFSIVSATSGRARYAGRGRINSKLRPSVDDAPAAFIWHLDIAALERISADSRTPAEVLEELASYPHPDIRAIIAENPTTPELARRALLNDENPNVRYQLAESPHLPIEMLQKLANDDNPYVACRAQRTMERVNQYAVV